MKIQDLFKRDIRRPINGVIKADQLDALSVWQELDEFVVTRELTQHLDELVSVLLSAVESEEDATGKNGIWISGFFGCGKSHLIKVLSYLLENEEHTHDGERRRAVEFFAGKFADAMLFADLKKVVSAKTATILFNIDSKADHRHREAGQPHLHAAGIVRGGGVVGREQLTEVGPLQLLDDLPRRVGGHRDLAVHLGGGHRADQGLRESQQDGGQHREGDRDLENAESSPTAARSVPLQPTRPGEPARRPRGRLLEYPSLITP